MHNAIPLSIALIALTGLLILFGLLIADCINHRRREAWRRENDKRRQAEED